MMPLYHDLFIAHLSPGGMKRGRLLCLLALGLVLVACAQERPGLVPVPVREVAIEVDGRTLAIRSSASNVRELLAEQDVIVGDGDEIDPPLFTPLSNNMTVTIVRVSEEILLVEESIPFVRKIVRSETMGADEPQRILQQGEPGLQELTVRVVFRDGVEAERQTIQIAPVKEPVDEIVMVGVGAAPGNVLFPGLMAFISAGRGLILRGSTAFPEQLALGGPLDGRVFQLSPTGEYLLFTRQEEGAAFNSLWIVGTGRGARPQSLAARNVLWAAWNPAAIRQPQVAYTTAIPTSVSPGWEANNDLWLVAAPDPAATAERELLVEAYPATLGWWGGNYAWSPTGRVIAYAYADEVGIVEVTDEAPLPRRQLYRFVEFETLADWVWVPTLTWSPDGRYLAFTAHAGDRGAGSFDTLVVDIGNGLIGRFVPQSGMWGHPHWSPPGSASAEVTSSQIAFLRATNPIDSLRSSYTLWLMDQDGSNADQLYPAPGENSAFPREWQFMSWGPTGRDLAFIFGSALYLYNLDSQTGFRITQDEANLSHPTWAPYGAGLGAALPATEIVPVEEIDELDAPGRTLPVE